MGLRTFCTANKGGVMLPLLHSSYVRPKCLSQLSVIDLRLCRRRPFLLVGLQDHPLVRCHGVRIDGRSEQMVQMHMRRQKRQSGTLTKSTRPFSCGCSLRLLSVKDDEGH